MIKPTTVLKRMIKDSWKPVLTFAVVIGSIAGGSVLANKMLGWDADAVYWMGVSLLFLGASLKWAYDWKRDQIEYEQKAMLRDLERKHL